MNTPCGTVPRDAQTPATWLAALAVAVVMQCGLDPARGEPAAPDRGPGLAAREQELLRQYRELERSFLRLADLLETSDPRRAAILRTACDRARGERIADRFEIIVGELEAGRLLKAGAEQREAIGRLEGLLQLLAAGADDGRPPDGREQVRQFLGRVTRAIARQRDIQGGTESGAAADDISGRQGALANETRALAAEIEHFVERSRGRAGTPQPSQNAGGQHGKPGTPGETPPDQRRGESGGGRPEGAADGGAADGGAADRDSAAGDRADPDATGRSGDETGRDEAGDDDTGDDDTARAARTQRRLRAAEQRMRQAAQAVEEARRHDARAEQEKALESLETARAELERILRQLREEEVERLLVQLAARVRNMLKEELAVRSGVGEVAAEQGPQGRERELEAARLAREQSKVGAAARRTLALLRDDGSAVAIPQALEQIRDDSDEAVRRLERADIGGTTRGLLDDLVAGLEELLAAVERARSDQDRQETGRQGEGRPARPGEQPLVDALAELRMLRSLQVRVNTRTARLAHLLGDGADAVEEPELRATLGRLAERQRLIERAAFDIVGGRTE